MDYLNLSTIPVGTDVYIKELHTKGPIRRRLLDIGLTPGACVSCLYESPSGDPRAYDIRGATIALRSEDAKKVEVTDAL